MTAPTDCNMQPVMRGLFKELPQPGEGRVQQGRAQQASKRRRGAPRLLQPNRSKVELRGPQIVSTRGLLGQADVGYVVRQDLSKLLEAIKARGSHAGRAAIDPRILFALRLYATLDGVGSGREIARLSLEEDAGAGSAAACR